MNPILRKPDEEANRLADLWLPGGRVCPYCERVSRKGERMQRMSVGYAVFDQVGACRSCAAAIRALSLTKCSGWLNERLKKVEKIKGKCHLLKEWSMCRACGLDPLMEILNIRGVNLEEGSACPVCRRSKPGVIPLMIADEYLTYQVLMCRCCDGLWVVSGLGCLYASLYAGARDTLLRSQALRASQAGE